MDLRPIPAFYCCYLLRSIAHHTSLYVGSTPNPQRRLAQHNGFSKGGAVRTARDKLRPWEMACVVMGFPSNIAALQFEWAWQNTHLTKRITDEARITARHTKTRISPTTGRTRKRPARPRASLSDKLANLHLLLRVPSFARWPLEVRFFCEDVFRLWQRWNDQTEERICSEIPITLDLKQPRALPANNSVLTNVQLKSDHRTKFLSKGGMEGIDASYQGMKTHVEKSLFLLAEGESVKCAICDIELGEQRSTALVCSVDACTMASHLSCLARTFIEEDADQSPVLPRAGKCPCCKHDLVWVDLVKDLSLRVRGDKDIAQLMKKPKSRKVKAHSSTQVLSAKLVSDSDEEEKAAILDETTDEPLSDDWHCAIDDDDTVSIFSAASDITEQKHRK